MKNIIYIIITAILLCIILHQHSIINAPLPPPVVMSDTVIKHDTLFFPKPVPYEVKIIDTLYLNLDTSNIEVEDDSILVLPLERKVYEDSTYRAVITGFAATLDTIITYPKEVYITNTKTLYKPKKGFRITPQLGIGYGLINRKPDVFLGVGISYNF